MSGLSRPGADEEPPLAGSVGVPAVQMPGHTRGRDEAHVEAATTGFVSQGLRDVRFPDTRKTLDRLTVEVTDSMSICRRVISAPAGDGRSVDGGPMRSGHAISYESDTNSAAPAQRT